MRAGGGLGRRCAACSLQPAPRDPAARALAVCAWRLGHSCLGCAGRGGSLIAGCGGQRRTWPRSPADRALRSSKALESVGDEGLTPGACLV